MSRTVVDIDDEALAEAMKEYRAQTKVDAVNRALREVAHRRAERLRKAFGEWDRMAADMAETDWGEAWRRGSESSPESTTKEK
ncbi:MAG: type II toxin-antitoxin system VapB family antitoxin [Thermoanaerobaculia bacterium]